METAAVLAVKEAVINAAGTVTDDGTVSAGLLLVSVMTAPPAGAGCVSDTVQEADEFDPKLAGLHNSEETTTATVRLTVAPAELPL